MLAPHDRDDAGRGPEGSRLSVVVDARALHVSGLGRYLREILKAIFADARFQRISLLGHSEELREYCASRVEAERVEVHDYSHPFYSPALNLSWARLRARGHARADVVFFPHFDAPVVGLPRRSVVTVQDLIHLKVPEAYPAAKRFLAGTVIDRVVSRAGRVLVTSDNTRRDLLERQPRSASRLQVIPLGVDEATWGAPGADRVGTFERAPYLLCVGNRKRHKNMVAAVEALARLKADWPELRLVIVGREFGQSDGVQERARTLGVSDAIEVRSGVDDGELRQLYRNAEALLFLSLYEGFGLPVLEAMASGTPVIASDRASVPEVVGDAGLIVDPTDADAVAGAVRRIRDEPRLRDSLMARGRERASRFTWRATGARTVEVLAAIAAADPTIVAQPLASSGAGAGV